MLWRAPSAQRMPRVREFAPLEGERLGRPPVGLRRGALRANAGAFLPGPDERRGQPGAGVSRVGEAGGYGTIGGGSGAVGPRAHEGRAVVTAIDHRGVERHCAEERCAERLRQPLASALAKDVGDRAAVGAAEAAHVLDHAEKRHLHLLEHPGSAPGDLEANVLRRGHYHRARERKVLRERQLCVAGAGGQVEDQIVEPAPGDVADEELQVLRHHWAAHHCGRVVAGQHRHRHDLEALRLDGDHLLVARDGGLRVCRQAEHTRDAWPEEVGVDQPHPEARVSERHREVDTQCGLADAALAGGNGDNAADASKGGGPARRGWIGRGEDRCASHVGDLLVLTATGLKHGGISGRNARTGARGLRAARRCLRQRCGPLAAADVSRWAQSAQIPKATITTVISCRHH